MCVVSAIHDYGRQVQPPIWQLPNAIDVFQDLVKHAEEFDKVAQQPHCEDPAKTKFLADLVAQRDAAKKDTTAKQRDALASKLAKAEAELEKITTERDAALKERDGLYTERNQCVALIARMAKKQGYDVAISPGADPNWPIVYVQLPTGQVSWHFGSTDANLFEGLPFGQRKWDNHTTAIKYARVNLAFNDVKPRLRTVSLGGVDLHHGGFIQAAVDPLIGAAK